MIDDQNGKTGLDYVLAELTRRFRSNEDGRLVTTASEGVLPRFVLGRSAEGCVWRFSADLSSDRVRSVAKLAGREKGRSIDPQSTAQPERLVMICRLLRNGDEVPEPQREPLRREGQIVGELWIVD